MTEQLALTKDGETAVLPNGERLPIQTAQYRGYVIRRVRTYRQAKTLGFEGKALAHFVDEASRAEEAARATQALYADTILALPEARERPLAARKIAMCYGASAMPVDRAARMLRGLPSERRGATGDLAVKPFAKPTPAVLSASDISDAKLKRMIELKVAALSVAANGDRETRSSLSLVLQLVDKRAMTPAQALAYVGIDIRSVVPGQFAKAS